MMKKIALAIVILVGVGCLSWYFISGAGKTKGKVYGKEIPSDAVIIPIAEVLGNPTRYTKQEAVVEGVITSECPAGGWFFLQDKTGQIFVNLHPTFIAIPQKVGAKAKAIGKLQVSDQFVQFVGTGVLVR